MVVDKGLGEKLIINEINSVKKLIVSEQLSEKLFA